MWERGDAGAQNEGFSQENRTSAPTTGQASLRYSRSICPVFVGAPLRGRPLMRKISFQCRLRRHTTNFVHFAALPQKFSLWSVPPFSKKALPFWNLAVHSTAYNALLTRNSACKFRLKRHACSLNRATTQGRPYGCLFRNVDFPGLPQNANAVRFVGKRRHRCPKRRFFAGKPNKCADDESSVTALFSVNLPGFRRGDPAWSPVNGKNFISMPSSLARDQLCSLRGFAPYDRFFLYPTKPSKCAECRRRGTR